jgi:hypothetical protein
MRRRYWSWRAIWPFAWAYWDRWTFAANLLHTNLGTTAPDACLLGPITHYLTSARNLDLFRRVDAALLPGGIVALDVPMAGSEASEWMEVVSLPLWVNGGGAAHSFVAYCALLEQAGFADQAAERALAGDTRGRHPAGEGQLRVRPPPRSSSAWPMRPGGDNCGSRQWTAFRYGVRFGIQTPLSLRRDSQFPESHTGFSLLTFDMYLGGKAQCLLSGVRYTFCWPFLCSLAAWG